MYRIVYRLGICGTRTHVCHIGKTSFLGRVSDDENAEKTENTVAFKANEVTSNIIPRVMQPDMDLKISSFVTKNCFTTN